MAPESIVEQPPIKSPETAPAKTEQTPSPENKVELVSAKTEQIIVAPKPIEKSANIAVPQNPPAQSAETKRAMEIDMILSSGLNEVFLNMTPVQQNTFKKTGEDAVVKINQLLSETKVKVNKIIDIIRKWLKLIPGVNKFFLEQEVKIKTDKILKTKNKF